MSVLVNRVYKHVSVSVLYLIPWQRLTATVEWDIRRTWPW